MRCGADLIFSIFWHQEWPLGDVRLCVKVNKYIFDIFIPSLLMSRPSSTILIRLPWIINTWYGLRWHGRHSGRYGSHIFGSTHIWHEGPSWIPALPRWAGSPILKSAVLTTELVIFIHGYTLMCLLLCLAEMLVCASGILGPSHVLTKWASFMFLYSSFVFFPFYWFLLESFVCSKQVWTIASNRANCMM